MAALQQISAGMTITLSGKLYRVESSVKVTVPKGTPFIKTKLRDLVTNEVIEKNFKPNQTAEEVTLSERTLEYLYMEGKDYLFLDVGNLEQVLIPANVIGDKVNFLREGIDLKASFYGDMIFSVELPQFLELMVAKVEGESSHSAAAANSSKIAVLETGAKIEVPPFIEVGDIIKVDTRTEEYIQRV